MTKKSTIDSFKKKLEELVQKFTKDEEFYMSDEYNESQARLDFIDKFFYALGWDLDNSLGVPYHRREVIVERGDANKRDRPDYTFRMNGRTKFFVEAKAPNQPLDNIYHIHQAKSYAWSSPDASVAILTDFERIKIFDCRAIPEVDKPNKGLIKDIHWKEYSQHIEFLWLLSKDSVEAGSMETLLGESTISKKHRIKVDKQFLKDLMAWRLVLANMIFKDNKSIELKTLEAVVDLIINRVVFLRVAEDREILTRPTLISFVAHWKETKSFDLWDKFLNHFSDINDDLNGVLFKPNSDFESLKIDNDLLHDFVTNHYFPMSPYRFDEIPIELLGTIYEQYLGKEFGIKNRTIVLEDKPEVRKSGGVFYTPQNIVETIVQNTIGAYTKGKKYSEISKITILDPACGSGSFLITAFGKLVEFHLDYLINHPKEVSQGKFFPDLVKDDRGEWKLSIEKKRDLLQNSIFGVDIDQQAINICVMSLYLKALEGEQRLPIKKSLLPTLDKNIRCGNSLVSGNTAELKELIGDQYETRNPFNWAINYTRVMRDKGGFDIIVMNPPYVKIQKMMEDDINDVQFIQTKYRTTSEGSADIYVAFIEKSMSLLNEKGTLGLICPHKFFQADYGAGLRSLLTEKQSIYEIVSFGDIQIFEKASTYTCLLYCTKIPHRDIKFSRIKSDENFQMSLTTTLTQTKPIETDAIVLDFVSAKELQESAEWHFVVGREKAPFQKLSSSQTFLGNVAEDIYQGVITGADDVFILMGSLLPKRRIQKLHSIQLNKVVEVETDILRPMLQGFTDVKPFSLNQPTAYLILPYSTNSLGKPELIPNARMKSDFPKTWAYLKENKELLEARERGKWAGPDFHCYSRNQNLLRFQSEKILIPYMVNKLTAHYDQSGGKYFVNVTTGGYGLTLKSNAKISYLFLTGLLNSSAMNFFLKKVGSTFRGGFFPCSTQYLRKLPIVIPETPNQKKLAAKIENLMKVITEHISSSGAMSTGEIFENQNTLDELVNELYGVKEFEEIIRAG